jgi:hypothetical protein
VVHNHEKPGLLDARFRGHDIVDGRDKPGHDDGA